MQRGAPADEEKPKFASLLKNINPADVTLEFALRPLELPRKLGEHPETGKPVIAHNGRFGPYLQCDKETRSLPADVSLLDVTLEQALAILAQPKVRGRGRAAPKEPVKTLAESPITRKPVQVLDGRYGMYVTDGETNASLPKDVTPDTLTMELALQLLADRAAMAQAKRGKKGEARGPTKASSTGKTRSTSRKRASSTR